MVYDEVKANSHEDDDFIIKPVTKMAKIEEEVEEEQQITLTFDLPLSNIEIDDDENDILQEELSKKAKKLPVKDYIELITVTESNEEGEVRYALDDYIELESTMNRKKAKNKEVIEKADFDVVFEKKVVSKPVTEESVTEEIDPMNSPISELLKERAEERRRKMKDFNYKFNNAKIDEIEKEPAYKRQGVSLKEVQHSSSETEISRTSIGLDDNDDVQLRSNNSYLHDNVD